jgi:catechol 2,3-dioxygenase-like lactoylglutathione lyase family enzyme
MAIIHGVDHIVLSVADVDRSLAFYCGALGLATEREADYRAGRVNFPSVRIDERFVIDLFPRAADAGPVVGANVDHFCLVTDADDLAPLLAHLERHDVPILGPPRSRWGAQGLAMSVYVRDPDGNQVEIRTYAPAARAEAERLRPNG